jgi:O-6-methylguanine DNA methyltransferase
MGFADFPFESRYVTLNGHRLHYIDEGEGPVLLFIHGNPTSSYLWRNVIKPLRDQYRCIALDLIGFGNSDQPDIDYRFLTHYRYLEDFVAALNLTDITLVLHDWGGPLGFRLAQQQPHTISRLCFMETFPFTFDWDEFPLPLRPLFFAFRQERLGRFLIINRNLFVRMVLPFGVIRHLPRSVRRIYQRPFRQRESRYPVYVWPNQLPINDRQDETWRAIEDIEKGLGSMPQPMLLLRFRPGAVLGPARIRWLLGQIPNLDISDCGRGLHYVQEDNPQAIAEAIQHWLHPMSEKDAERQDAAAGPHRHESDSYAGKLTWYYGESRYGNALVAESTHGLIHFDFCDDKDQAQTRLQQRFPDASLTEQPTPTLLATLDHPDSAPAPLHLCGTPFQRQVWQALLGIPSGSTRHYGEIAQQLGSQARAVGQAVGKNRLAILVPCHRVTRADGGPGGFYWGTTLKQRLLDQERTTTGHAP